MVGSVVGGVGFVVGSVVGGVFFVVGSVVDGVGFAVVGSGVFSGFRMMGALSKRSKRSSLMTFPDFRICLTTRTLFHFKASVYPSTLFGRRSLSRLKSSSTIFFLQVITSPEAFSTEYSVSKANCSSLRRHAVRSNGRYSSDR